MNIYFATLQIICIFVSAIQLNLLIMGTLTITTYTLPAHWASALINADNSGLTDSEKLELNTWLEDHKPGYCVDCSEESFFGRFGGMGCELLEYQFTN